MKRTFESHKIMLASVLYVLMLLFPSCKKEAGLAQDLHPPVPAPQAPKDSVTMVLSSFHRAINDKIGGYYVALPSNYQQTTRSYPLLVYMHGAGQFGNGTSDLPLLLKDGVAQVISAKKFPGSFVVNGKEHSFIVLMPQTSTFPVAADVSDCIELAKKTWRVDASRVYVSGLSAGSIASCDLAAALTSKIAALVPMAGVPADYASTDKCQKIAAGRLPVWAFHCEDDPQINVGIAKGFINKIKASNPAIVPRLTIWPSGGHDAWTRAVQPTYREQGKNIYEWMLQFSR